MAKFHSNMIGGASLFAILSICFFIGQTSALDCYNCGWSSSRSRSSECRNSSRKSQVVECAGLNVANFYQMLTVKTSPPVCVKAKFHLDDGSIGVLRYCGYPIANAGSCIVSMEASSHPDTSSTTTRYDTSKPITFFYCNDKDGCNDGSAEGPCDEKLAGGGDEASNNNGSNGIVQLSSVLALLLTGINFAKMLY